MGPLRNGHGYLRNQGALLGKHCHTQFVLPKLEMELRILAMVPVMNDQLAITIQRSQDGRQKIYIIFYNLGTVFVVVCTSVQSGEKKRLHTFPNILERI